MGSTSFLSNKTFYTLMIPLASMVFCCIPPIVVQQLPVYANAQYKIPSYSRLTLGMMRKWLPNYASTRSFPQDEIPLLFRHEKYPDEGPHKMLFHDYKYLRMAEILQKKQDSGDIPFFGYIYIFENKDSQELPTVSCKSTPKVKI